MKLSALYKSAVQAGIAHDLRGKKEITRLLKEEKKTHGDLKGEEKQYYDPDRLFNPYSDSRILHGSPETEVKKVIVGIDMQVSEILLTYTLNRDRKAGIDLIVAHHPEGHALARLYDVMRLQSDLLTNAGVSVSVAEMLMDKRISEIERRLLPVNHERAVQVARLLDIPFLCLHTPADNCVTHFLDKTFSQKKPYRLKDIVEILKSIPEYKKSLELQVPPKIVNGSENNRSGKIYVDMTGGTGGSSEVFEKLAASGISTVVGMHFSETHIESAKKANLNLVIAGHIASDVLGLNLMFDEIEKVERLDFVEVSGFERRRRKPKSI
jgi:putative NIF3 family GTP cyclohydrolase 1 type 2